MHIEWIRLNDYKGITHSFQDLKRASVFFGPNGAGKTNILEAIAWVAGWDRPVVRGRQAASPWAGVSLLLEGDDDLLFRFLFQDLGTGEFRDVLTVTPEGRPRATQPSVARMELKDALPELRREILRAVKASTVDWHSIGPPSRLVLDTWLDSRWFWMIPGGIFWVFPPGDRLSRRVRDAAIFLSDASLCGDLPPFLSSAGPCLDLTKLLEPGEADSVPVERMDPFWWRDVGSWEEKPEVSPVGLVRLSDSPSAIEDTSGLVARMLATITPVGDELPKPTDDYLDPAYWGGEWYEYDEEGWTRVRPIVSYLCTTLSEGATAIAPSFISKDFDIIVEALGPLEVREPGQGDVRILLEEKASQARIDLGGAGSGVVVWSLYAIREALRELRLELGSLPWKELTIYVIDEPERHLHPTAQREVSEWLAERVKVEKYSAFFLATHSSVFLDLPLEDAGVDYFGVRRGEDGTARIDRLSEHLLKEIDHLTEEFGFTRAEVLQLHRTVLIVEGVHDERVLTKFFLRQLRERRVMLLPIHGIFQLGLATVEWLARQGKAVRILFDNVRAEALRGGALPRGYRPRQEEERLLRILEPLRGLTREPGLDVVAVPFDLPDIVFALPEDSVRTLLRDFQLPPERFQGWTRLAEEWRAVEGELGCKAFAIRELGLQGKVNPKVLVSELLARCPDNSRPADLLEAAVAEAIA